MAEAANVRLGAGTPPTPPSGEGALYFDQSDGQLYAIDAAGNKIGPITGGANATQLQGYDVSTSAPSGGSVLAYDGDEWVPTIFAFPVPTLQTAYNGGAVINASLGAVNIYNPSPGGAHEALTVSSNGQLAPALRVTSTSGAGADGVHVTCTGNGIGLIVDVQGGSKGIIVTHPGTNDGIVVESPAGAARMSGNGLTAEKLAFASYTAPTPRVQIIGDPGTGGHYSPRVQRSFPLTNLGALARCSATAPITANGFDQDLSTDTTFPTFVEIDPGAGTINVKLPDSPNYPVGTEIFILNTGGVSLTLTSYAGPTVNSIVNVAGVAAPNVTVSAGTGVKLVSRSIGWTVTGTF